MLIAMLEWYTLKDFFFKQKTAYEVRISDWSSDVCSSDRLAWPHLKRDWPVLRANWPIVGLLGALAIGSFNILLYTGLQSTTALNSMLIQSAQPALVLIAGALVMGDRTSVRQVAGVLISLAGVLAIIGRGDPAMLWGLRLNSGDAIISVAVLIWALYSVLLRRRPVRSEEHTSELQSLMRISYAVFCLKKKIQE